MLYINGQHVDLSNQKTDYKFAKITKDYRETIDNLRKRHGGQILLMSMHQPKLDSVSKLRRPHKTITVPYKANVYSKESGNQKWVYSIEGAKIKDGVATPSEICFLLKHGSMTLSLDSDAELIFFITKTGKFQNKKIFIYDENEKQDEIANKRSQEVKLSNAIYSETSPLNDKNTLDEIARKWGLSGLDTMKANTIKNILHGKVFEAEEQRKRGNTKAGLDAFLLDLDQGASLVIGSDIQLAIDKGLLTFSKESNEWLLIVEKDQDPWSIMRVDGLDTPNAKEVLAQYLQHNPSYSEKLSLIISGNAKIDKGQIVEGAPEYADDKVDELNADNVMEEDNYAVLQAAYAHHGLGKSIGKKKDFLKEGLLEFFKAQPQEVN